MCRFFAEKGFVRPAIALGVRRRCKRMNLTNIAPCSSLATLKIDATKLFFL